MHLRSLTLIALACILAPRWAAAQSTDTARSAPAPLDGPNRPLRDSLLDRLVGSWRVSREMQNRTTITAVTAEWVLNHQFVRLHYRDQSTPSSYEAMVFIGYDNASERYVAHWLDVFGGRWSETLAYGTPVPRGIRLLFEYPDGPFVNTFTFDDAKKEWASVMRRKNARGEWVMFGQERWTRN